MMPSAIAIMPAGSEASTVGPAETFTGTVHVDSRFHGETPARISGATVTFEPGARTAWHTHPLGQTLTVIAGVGLVQEWGGPVQQIRIGDTVWIPPAIKHWHGAGSANTMAHIAISEVLDGETVVWLEQVTDKQYQQIGQGAARP
jgi:quercetin dioxygenase-like cupin family protein